MSEKEKMLQGVAFDSRDQELLSMHYAAQKLIKEYNSTASDQHEKRDQLLVELLGYKGSGVWIEMPFYCNYGQNITLGENTFINVNCLFQDDNKISIGKNGLIGPYVQIYTATHPLRASDRIIIQENRTHYKTSSKPVQVGDNVWLGGNVVIMPGITIGDNVTIGAGSLVTRDIPDSVVAFGNPCKVRQKF